MQTAPECDFISGSLAFLCCSKCGPHTQYLPHQFRRLGLLYPTPNPHVHFSKLSRCLDTLQSSRHGSDWHGSTVQGGPVKAERGSHPHKLGSQRWGRGGRICTCNKFPGGPHFENHSLGVSSQVSQAPGASVPLWEGYSHSRTGSGWTGLGPCPLLCTQTLLGTNLSRVLRRVPCFLELQHPGVKVMNLQGFRGSSRCNDSRAPGPQGDSSWFSTSVGVDSLGSPQLSPSTGSVPLMLTARCLLCC